MRTTRGLFHRLCQASHLNAACDFTVRGKRRRPEVAWFLFRREDELRTLRDEIATGRYRPAELEWVTIRDPKPRLIARLPIRDRVAQNAVVLLLQPIFERSLRPEAFACRRGYGTHRAVLRLLELLRCHAYVLHLDVRKYFPSIDLEVLRRLLARRVRDRRFLALVDQVLEGTAGMYDREPVRSAARLGPHWPPPGRGLPIGSATSQLFAAHVYLAELDHFVKRRLHVPGYLRYLDDLFLFGGRRNKLVAWRASVAEWLDRERGLVLKRPAARVRSCRGTLDALGYRLRRDGLSARPRAYRRLQRSVAEELDPSPGRGGGVDFARSLAASAGVLLF